MSEEKHYKNNWWDKPSSPRQVLDMHVREMTRTIVRMERLPVFAEALRRELECVLEATGENLSIHQRAALAQTISAMEAMKKAF